MELRHLRYFVALADTLSFTRAAESLYVSQSTLSQQIADLERELGTKLFNRSCRQVRLTAAGEALLDEARDILGRVDGLAGTARNAHATARTIRPLRIGFDSRVLGSDFLKQAITQLLYEQHGEHPDLHVSFVADEYDGAVQRLREGDVDLSFFLHQQPTITCEPRCASQCLYEDELALVVRTPDELDDSPETLRRVLTRRGVTLLEGEGRGLMQALRIFDELGIEPKIYFAPNRETMLLSINSGERASVLPKGLITRLVEPDARTLRLRCPSARLYVLAAWPEHGMHPLAAQVVDAVNEAMRPWIKRRAAELAADAEG